MKLNFTPFPTLTTNRLNLVALTQDHKVVLNDYYSKKENFAPAIINTHDNMQDTLDYIYKMQQGVMQNQWVIWAITLKTTGQVLGTLSLWNFDIINKKAEVGFGLHPQARQQGYMTEALARVISYGFNDLNLASIEGYTSPNNKASIHVLTSAGFSFVDTIEDDYSQGEVMSIYKKTNCLK